MDTIPTEILLEIGKTDLETYVGMLAIPKFARAVTIGYRLDMMVKSNYKYRILIEYSCPRTKCLESRLSNNQKLLWNVYDFHQHIEFGIWIHADIVSGTENMIYRSGTTDFVTNLIHGVYSRNDGSRLFKEHTKMMGSNTFGDGWR